MDVQDAPRLRAGPRDANIIVIVGSLLAGRLAFLNEMLRRYPSVFVPIVLRTSCVETMTEDERWFVHTPVREISQMSLSDLVVFFREGDGRYALVLNDIAKALEFLKPRQRCLLGLTGDGYAQLQGRTIDIGSRIVACSLHIPDDAAFLQYLIEHDRMSVEEAGLMLERAKRDSSYPPGAAGAPPLLQTRMRHPNDVTGITSLLDAFMT
jgi:hypothetical protein